MFKVTYKTMKIFTSLLFIVIYQISAMNVRKLTIIVILVRKPKCVNHGFDYLRTKHQTEVRVYISDVFICLTR